MEQFISFTYDNCEIKDSLQFLPTSLDNLSKTLPTNDPDLNEILEEALIGFENSDELRPYIRRKGIFPYAELTSVQALNETTDLFPIESFDNDLDGSKCDIKSYEDIKRVWQLCGGSFRRYHDFYLQKDVALLAASFQNFRKQSHDIYGLDPTHYYSLPSYTFDAVFRYTNVELQLITEEKIYNLIKASIRGGLSFACKRYAKANNPYMVNFDETKEKVYIIYVDANNLYGLGMTMHLPVGNFKLLTKESHPYDFERLSNPLYITRLDPYGKKCYLFTFDGYVPKELHNYFKDYPLFPESVEIQENMLSELQRNIYPEPDLKPAKRLVSTLLEKKYYAAHFRMVQFAINRGFVITKIHNIIVCNQKPWLKDYIDLNNGLRTKASENGDKFKVSLMKNMNNHFFGKTCENTKNRVNILIKYDDESTRKQISKPSFKKSKIINNDLLMIETTIQKLLLDKPLYIGACVLELSKLRMFEFHYDVMKKFYGENQISLLYTDTDSFVYEIRTEDVYEDMLQENMISEFDFSSYSLNAIQFQKVKNFNKLRKSNEKVLGKMKDELGDFIIDEWCALKSKAYSYTMQVPVTHEEMKDTQYQYTLFNPHNQISCHIYAKVVAKGVRDYIRRMNLSFAHYKQLMKNLRKAL